MADRTHFCLIERFLALESDVCAATESCHTVYPQGAMEHFHVTTVALSCSLLALSCPAFGAVMLIYCCLVAGEPQKQRPWRSRSLLWQRARR